MPLNAPLLVGEEDQRPKRSGLCKAGLALVAAAAGLNVYRLFNNTGFSSHTPVENDELVVNLAASNANATDTSTTTDGNETKKESKEAKMFKELGSEFKKFSKDVLP